MGWGGICGFVDSLVLKLEGVWTMIAFYLMEDFVDLRWQDGRLVV